MQKMKIFIVELYYLCVEELDEEKQQLHAKVEAEIVEVQIQQDLECQQLIHV